MSVVLDASVTLAWQFREAQTDAALAVLADVSKAGAVVPVLWRFEVANGLQMGVRRGRIEAKDRDDALLDLSVLEIRVDEECADRAWSTTVTLSELYGLTVYDAAYLELAQRLRLPLATLDDALTRASRAAGVALRL